MPIFHHDIEQGTDEWFRARMGIPTASEYGKILTPGGKLSEQAEDYAMLKVAEIMTGEYQGIMKPTFYMERGKLMEAEAISAYEFSEGVQVQKVGFVTDDDRRFGCSPDFLVGADGCGENKCLMAKEHLKWLLADRVKPEHKPQVMGQLLICERDWCDWNIYHPLLPRHKIREYRDDKYIAKLEDALDGFRDIMESIIVVLQTRDMWQVMGERISFHQAEPEPVKLAAAEVIAEVKAAKAPKKKAPKKVEPSTLKDDLQTLLSFDTDGVCQKCNGSGKVKFTDFDHISGDTYDAVEPCECLKGKP